MHNEELPASTLPKPRILLVDDEATLREHLARVLADEYVVDTAEDGRAALKAVLQVVPELVVTGHRYARHGWHRVAQDPAEYAQNSDSTGVADLRSGDRRAANRGLRCADGYLAKPYTERELRARIGSMLQSARRRDEATRRETLEQAERKGLSDRAALLESITDAFYALDREFRFTYLNQRTLEHFAATREMLLGNVLWEAIPPMRGTVFQQEYERALREQ